jgi:3'(2'), 5'-bisphosphate nucleotidase
MNHLLRIAIKAAIDAGEKIMKIYDSSDFGIETKEDSSPLTLADKAAHETITGQLISTGIPILSEEGKTIPWETRKTWETFWLVDPLDGTKEFIKKNGEFTVNIALIEKGNPIMGIVFVPVSGELFYADNDGSRVSVVSNFENTDPEQIMNNSVQLPLITQEEKFVVAGSRSHINTETENYIKQLDTGGRPLTMISKGSSLKICMVATGEADIYPRLGPTMEWDIAAGHAIAIYAGKSVTQYPSGEPVVYNKENLLSPFFVVK